MTLRTLQRHLTGDEARDPATIGALIDALVAWQPQVVLVFADVSHFAPHPGSSGPTAIQRMTEEVGKRLPQVQWAGCSTAGEIMGREVHTGSLAVTAVRADRSHVRVASLPIPQMEASRQVGRDLALTLPDHGPQGEPLSHLWVMGPGVRVNGSALLEGLKDGFEGRPLPSISGGLAADGGAFKQTWTLGSAGIQGDHAVVVGWYGADLRAGSSADGGWEPFGPSRRVTSVQGNVLLEMDDEPALAIYRRYLGDHARNLPAAGLLFPLQIVGDDDDAGIIRTILGIDDARGALILAGDIKTNTRVRLMHASSRHLVEAAESAAEAIVVGQNRHSEQSLALMVSCVGRRIVMGERTEEEVEAVCDVLPAGTATTGFYSNGEFAAWNFTGDCRLHNQTITITWLSEEG